GGKSWLNTDKQLSIAGLKGKIVLLDFWTYGCINCIHIIPDLKKLEAKYGDQLVVIGVHSAKFENEKDIENIRRVVRRYELEHPVVNDADFKIWDAYAVRAWPTQVLINPKGYIVTQTTGEGQLSFLDEKIGETIADAKAKNDLNTTPIKLALEKDKFKDSQLLFPGKVLADAKSNKLFISDSNHNRIVITKLDGTFIETIGGGKAGFDNGDFTTATLNRPQGLAFDGTFLYVADTENHAIRKVDLANKKVETIAGTGKQQDSRVVSGKGTEISINSPWDLALNGKQLYIAMAGNHQLWKLDLATNQIERFAGSGGEARLDGTLLESAFAQPSGLAFDGKILYVADAESNIIRAVNPTAKTVKTIVGGDLFEFGDVAGKGDDVRLQHPLGVAFYGKNILLTDTYNHKIKLLNPLTKTVTDFVGGAKSGNTDGAKAEFYEPGGLSVAGNKAFVADTNNQEIRVINLLTKQVSTLKINGLQSPQTAQ
ncbi:MAG: redoxin domain-containing protein, partial [Pyrinomonadaceae bacterium]|nr:redoxin domain-containing protein [Pyrinomonadaceae bacterium]